MQTQAVEQLGFVGGQRVRQAHDLRRVGVVRLLQGQPFGHRLQHRHALQQAGHFFERRGGVQAVQAQAVDGVDHRSAITARQPVDQPQHIRTVHRTQHLAHRGFLQLPATEGNGLVGQRERVAH
ncbi:hypothetical protein D9M69_620570 [compost metagenome]